VLEIDLTPGFFLLIMYQRGAYCGYVLMEGFVSKTVYILQRRID